MEPEVKEKFNWKRLLIAIGIVIVATAVIGGTVWYFMDKQAKEDKANAEKTLQDLQKQIDDLKKECAATAATPATGTATSASTTTAVNPVIAWKAGVDISTQERSTITTKVIEPYLAFEKEENKTIVSVTVEEVPHGNKKAGEYYYFIHVVRNDGYGGGWAFGESGNIDYWKAECGLGLCASDAFKTKYPNNWLY